MSGYMDIARRIPDRVRSGMLMVESDPIQKAVASGANKPMMLLFDIWNEFIEKKNPDDRDCPVCLKTMLSNFREIYPMLIQLEKEANLLKALKPK